MGHLHQAPVESSGAETPAQTHRSDLVTSLTETQMSLRNTATALVMAHLIRLHFIGNII